ncbi:MAG: hypothetical protein HYV08_12295 [Deltaproteobacteria bacterium]|nr:hypothetical protein [Deltaproteobacteria bacterium]
MHTGVGATRRFLAEHAGEAKAFLKAYVEGLYHFRANREFGVRTIGRYARTGDQEVLAEAYERYGLRYMEIPPHIHRRSIQGILEQLTGTFPEARAADPERFRDARFMEELEREGFFKALERSYRR